MEMQEKKVGTRCAESGWEDTKVEPSRLHNISAVEDTEFTQVRCRHSWAAFHTCKFDISCIGPLTPIVTILNQKQKARCLSYLSLESTLAPKWIYQEKNYFKSI